MVCGSQLWEPVRFRYALELLSPLSRRILRVKVHAFLSYQSALRYHFRTGNGVRLHACWTANLQISLPVAVQIAMLPTVKTLAYVTVTCVGEHSAQIAGIQPTGCRRYTVSARCGDKARSAPNCDQPYPNSIFQLHDWCSPPCFPAVSVRLHLVCLIHFAILS